MVRIIVYLTLLASTIASLPAWSRASSCNTDSDVAKPEWLSNMDYSLPNYYFGIGSAAKDGKSEDQQKIASENDAKQHLSEQIQVTVKADVEQSVRVNNQNVQKNSLSRVTVSTEEVLRGLKIKGFWVDKETCIRYTLMVINNDSVAQIKQEKLMKERLGQFKNQLAEGMDADKNPDINIRRKYLAGAQALLSGADFTFLADELKKEVYAKQMSDALDQISKESSLVQGRMALFAINNSVSISPNIIGKMLSKLKSGDNAIDSLLVTCNSDDDCISRAKERGFSKLTLLNVSTKVATSQLGVLQGNLTVAKLVYDIESRKILSGPDAVTTEVIGWSGEELDWYAAADAAVQRIKSSKE